MAQDKLKIGIFELTGCAGDALLIADCEEELVNIFSAADIEVFLMAKSDNRHGELDVALVEGSVSTDKEKEELLDIREKSKAVVAFGNCACVGGIQAAFLDNEEWKKNLEQVYGSHKFSHLRPVQSQPIDAFVPVDFYLPGCPVGKEQFLSTFNRLLRGNPPELFRFPVCVECKWQENDCLLNRDLICLGPLTRAGCGSVCPNHNIPCFGCWGPTEEANRTSEYQLLIEKGFDATAVRSRMGNYSGARIAGFFEPFRKEKR